MKRKLLILLFVIAFIASAFGYYKYTQYYYGAKCYQEFTIETEKDSFTFDYAQTLTIPVSLGNSSRTSVDTSNGYYLSYHLLDENGKELIFDGIRTMIDVAPFSDQDVELNFEVPEPGTYTLIIDVLNEGELWFEDAGGTVKKVTVLVQ